MPRRPSGPDLPGWPWGPTGPVFPTGPWVPVVPYRAEGQTQKVGHKEQNRSERLCWKAPYTTTELSVSHYPYLGSLHALLPFFSCSTYMALGLRKTTLLRWWQELLTTNKRTYSYTHMHTQNHIQYVKLTLRPGGPVGPGSPEAPGGPCREQEKGLKFKQKHVPIQSQKHWELSQHKWVKKNHCLLLCHCLHCLL